MRSNAMGSRVQDKVFREIYEILVKIESRLSIIEETIKKEDTKKQLLND
tara:strand:- start:630 stop:776 length:147 start_codon:yes stop_codon:yes gene_type:complete